MTTNNPTSPREELARTFGDTQVNMNMSVAEIIAHGSPSADVQEILLEAADEWLSRPPVKAASPEGVMAEMVERGKAALYPHLRERPIYQSADKMARDVIAAAFATPPTSERAEVVAVGIVREYLDAESAWREGTGGYGNKKPPRHGDPKTRRLQVASQALHAAMLAADPDSQGGAS